MVKFLVPLVLSLGLSACGSAGVNTIVPPVAPDDIPVSTSSGDLIAFAEAHGGGQTPGLAYAHALGSFSGEALTVDAYRVPGAQYSLVRYASESEVVNYLLDPPNLAEPVGGVTYAGPLDIFYRDNTSTSWTHADGVASIATNFSDNSIELSGNATGGGRGFDLSGNAADLGGNHFGGDVMLSVTGSNNALIQQGFLPVEAVHGVAGNSDHHFFGVVNGEMPDGSEVVSDFIVTLPCNC